LPSFIAEGKASPLSLYLGKRGKKRKKRLWAHLRSQKRGRKRKKRAGLKRCAHKEAKKEREAIQRIDVQKGNEEREGNWMARERRERFFFLFPSLLEKKGGRKSEVLDALVRKRARRGEKKTSRDCYSYAVGRKVEKRGKAFF